MPHKHEHHHHGHNHSHPTDEQTTKRIGMLSLFNLGIGGAVTYAGMKLGNPLVTVQGLHDSLDGALHGIKYYASKQKDVLKKRFWRKTAAVSLGLTALGIGAHEMQEALTDDNSSTTTDVIIAYGALGANVLGAGIILGVRSNPNSRDAFAHTVRYDLPASVLTAAGTSLELSGGLGVMTPAVVPAAIVCQLALGAHTVQETWQDIQQS